MQVVHVHDLRRIFGDSLDSADIALQRKRWREHLVEVQKERLLVSSLIVLWKQSVDYNSQTLDGAKGRHRELLKALNDIDAAVERATSVDDLVSTFPRILDESEWNHLVDVLRGGI